MWDFNIGVINKGIEFDKLDEFCDLFNLTNLATSPTCFTKIRKSTIDLILTNKGNCFQKTKVTETGLNDFHKLPSTFLRAHFSRLNPKTIYYRINKHAPLKKKFLRGDQAPFINKELRKATYDRSRFRNRFCNEMKSYIKNKETNVSRFERKVLEIISKILRMKT